ncbi:MAG: hypothetical protein FJ343_05500 [Sphingomonadales bacterium]|nr:hypothetical protein [Sphingomonadales bacterium]
MYPKPIVTLLERIFESQSSFTVKKASLDQDFLSLIALRNQLIGLNYSDPAYDEGEDAMNEAEDAFNEEHGPYLEEKLQNLHEAHFPGQDILLPTAYMASCYNESVIEEGSYELPMDEGILVDWEVAGQPTRRAKLVLVPAPLRFMLFDGEALQLLWSVEDEHVYHSPQV